MSSASDLSNAHRHHGAERVVSASRLNRSAEITVNFMAALPLTQQGVDVDRITINKQPVTLNELETALRAIFASQEDAERDRRGDGALRRGDGVLDAARAAGVSRTGIVTERMR